MNSLVEAFVKFCVAVHQSLLPRLSPTVCALEPLYEPEKVSVPLVAERFARFPPSETPEMVELVRPALLMVPATVGVTVMPLPEMANVLPNVRPFHESVEVEMEIAVAVVVE